MRIQIRPEVTVTGACAVYCVLHCQRESVEINSCVFTLLCQADYFVRVSLPQAGLAIIIVQEFFYVYRNTDFKDGQTMFQQFSFIWII